MHEVKAELIRLLKIPLIGVTAILVVNALGIETGSLKSAGADGIEFYPAEKVKSVETQRLGKSEGVEVSVPVVSSEVAEEVNASTYEKKPTLTGWTHLGTYSNGAWESRTIEISDLLLPQKSQSYVVIADSISIRVDYPSFPFYRLSDRTGFANKGDLMRIAELKSDIGKSRVWANVEVFRKIHH